MVDSSYGAWPMRRLQDECRDRGLPSGRVRVELAQRLTDHDASRPVVVAESDVPPPPVPPAVEPQRPEPEAAPSVFRSVWPTVPGGLDDASHLEYRRRTYLEAVAAGLEPRGGELGARRVGTDGGGEVYEISVRPGVAS